jgi:hypothetical protein
MEAFISSMISSGPLEKRPPHILLLIRSISKAGHFAHA